MDVDLPAEGQKRLLDDDYLSSSPWRNMASDSEESHPSPHKGAGLSESSTSATLNDSTVMDEMKIAKTLINDSQFEDNEPKDVRAQEEVLGGELGQPFRKKVRFSERGRQGSAPPRLELGINDISLPNIDRKGTLSALHDLSNSPQNGSVIVVTAKDGISQETGAKARMEGLLDDLETEVTCGLCAGVFIDPVALNPCSHVFCGSCIVNWLQSYQPSTRMSYTNPFPALKDYMRRMRDISDSRDEDGYGSTSSDEGTSPPRSGRARQYPEDGSDSEDDYYPVNPYLQRVRATEATAASDATVRIGISKTPKNGLACPTCRAQPVVDATGSCLVTSMHRPDLVRTANETEQAHKVYKKGDKLSSWEKFWRLSPELALSAEAPTIIGVLVPIALLRGVTKHPIVTFVKNLLLRERTEPTMGALLVIRFVQSAYDISLLLSGELGPETIAQTCSGCGEGVCGLPTRGCKIPRLIETERVTGSTSFTQVERLSTASQISNYSWAGYRDVFQHNYYELAKFVLFCIKKNRSVASSTAHTLGHMSDDTARALLEAVSTVFLSSSRLGSDWSCLVQEASQKITMANVIKATVARSIDGDEYSSLRGIFQRANKAWPWPRMTDPDRLCKHCVNVMLEASIFEWWMRESANPDVATQLPARQQDCKYGRSCAFQENLEHSKSFNHLCERLPENEFQASSQPTPNQDLGAAGNISSETLLRRAVIEIGEAFSLPRSVMDELRLQEARSSGARSRDGAGTDLIGRMESRGGNAIYADGDDDSYDSGDENGSREGTPASEIFRERGMESRATQTDIAESENGLAEEQATAVGRTVVDENGDHLELDEENDQMEVEDAFPPNAEHDGEVQMADETADGALNPTIEFESAFLDYDGGETQEDDALDTKDLEFQLAISSPGLGESGSLSRQASVVEELVASSHESFEDAALDAVSGTEARGRETSGAIRLQSHAIDRAQQHRNSSARSSPAPEPILA
ncbi:hypothetical protein QFC20_001768 [Naganishia adeliensis]|uniref:Uncharacterized protein n=1 Tax=Naganishia adeliensis TaxID=92952 RepID=A0ACC2WQJ2_9TREE|nr:hypothetical protein QFC20_001768 [Naganishia adeliensis]